MKHRIAIALAIAISAALLNLFAIRFTGTPGGDFGISTDAAKAILTHQNPYPPDTRLVPYPLTSAIVAIPFSWLPRGLAGASFIGISSFLLAMGITRSGKWTGLWLFASYPFFSAVFFSQWSPLAVASVFFPWLGIGALKPQLGLPSLVASRKSEAITVPILLLLASLIIRPAWPLEWWALAKEFPHFIPLFYCWPLILPLIWIRHRDSQLFLSMALMPQRWFYDPLLLWLIPKTESEYLAANVLSWLGGIAWVAFGVHHVYDSAWSLMILSCYTPMLLIIAVRKLRETATSSTDKRVRHLATAGACDGD